MKILQVVKTNKGAKWAFTQAHWLSQNDIDIVTVLPSLEEGLASDYKENNMNIIQGDFSLPIKTPWKIFSRIKEIRKTIEDVKPDIIHFHFVTNIMMGRIALRNSNIPRLFQVPGPLHLENKVFRNAEIMLAKKNDFWAGACKKTCEIYMENKVPHNKVFLGYYGGYGGEIINEYKKNGKKLHQEYEIQEGSILIGMVSYFYKPKAHLLQKRGIKGHEDFIDAIFLIKDKYPEVVGIIIGGPWGNSEKYMEKIKKYAYMKCGESIIFTGFRADLKEIYRELNIAVHPSHSENLGGAAESLAAGVPTITTNIGGFPDIVINNNTGFTVSAKNPEKLAIAMEEMLKDTPKSLKMAKKGRELVQEILNIENTSKKIIRIYKKILVETEGEKK